MGKRLDPDRHKKDAYASLTVNKMAEASRPYNYDSLSGSRLAKLRYNFQFKVSFNGKGNTMFKQIEKKSKASPSPAKYTSMDQLRSS